MRSPLTCGMAPLMNETSTLAFLDAVDVSLQHALATLAVPPDEPLPTPPDWNDALVRLEGNLTGWQTLLGEMASKVQATQAELTLLDNDLKRSLVAFATARKHLQGVAETN